MKINKNMAIYFGIFFVFFIMTTGIVAAGSETNSVIYEDRIVWVEEAKISMYNLTTSKETRISQGPG